MAGWLLQLIVGSLVGVVALWILANRYSMPGQQSLPTADEVRRNAPVSEKTQQFERRFADGALKIIEVVGGVLVAVGASSSNSIIVDAPEGLIILDTAETRETAAKIYRQLRQINSRPVKAVIYTHFHPDHVSGTEEFIKGAQGDVEVWAYHTMPIMTHETMRAGYRTSVGSIYQMGITLGPAQFFPRWPHGLKVTRVHMPNRFVYEETEQVTIAGLNVTFLHTPSETDDHVSVWLEDRRVLLSGDCVLPSFPNVYAIRGTPPRDILAWAGSVRRLRSLGADYMVPSHLRPISGAGEVESLLTAYVMGMQYVHDQTVRHMNELRHPDEIARLVRLPPELASHPYLGEFYGRVSWSTKGVYQRYVGWFSGDPVELQPLTPTDKSHRMSELIGADRLLAEAELAVKAGDLQWALELCSYVFRTDPDNRRAVGLRVHILRTLAANQINNLARNFYLTSALDTLGQLDIKLDTAAVAMQTPMRVVLDLLKVRLKAELTHGANETLHLHFDDSNTTFRLQVLYSVLTVDDVTSTYNQVDASVETLTVTTSENVWKSIMVGTLPAATAFNNARLNVTRGSIQRVRQFFSYFL